MLIRKDKIVRFLCRNIKDIDQTDREFNTALHHAVRKNHPKMVYNLLLVNSDTELRNKERHTPYDIALIDNHSSILGLFV